MFQLSTRFAPFQLTYEVKLALPIECEIMTFQAIQHWLGMEELVHNMHLKLVELEENQM